MLREIYVRPLGLYAARIGEDAEEVWGGLRLGDGWLDFTGVEVIERNGARVDRRVAGVGEFFERDWGRRALNAADMSQMIHQPRARIAGLDLSKPRIMGIVNVTPDSFSDGGRLGDTQAALDHARRLEDAGDDADALWNGRQLLGDESLDPDVLEADGVEHPGGGLPDAWRRIAPPRLEGEALGHEAPDAAQIQKGLELGAVPESPGGREDRVA